MEIFKSIRNFFKIGTKNHNRPANHDRSIIHRHPKGRFHKGKDQYLIEIRIIDRELKSKIKRLEKEIFQKFGIGQQHFVPHISLAGGFETSDERKLIQVFHEICSDNPVMKFRIKGFSVFEEPKRVVFFNINPNEELKQFRYNLTQRLQPFCSLNKYDLHGKDEFAFHSTLSLNMPVGKFAKIQDYLCHKQYDTPEYCATRITIVKNRIILREYDFLQRKLLTREEAKDPHYYRITEDLAKKTCKSENWLKKENIPVIEEKFPFYLIADTHFDHDNIIRFCHRPFTSREQMNSTLLENWNLTVKKTDRVYFLGDMSFGRNSRPAEYWLDRLNGDITFIKGSHDKSDLVHYHDAIIVKYHEKNFLLIHDPANVPEDWTDWVIHGHHHNNNLKEFPFLNQQRKTINVSVELVEYRPINIEQLNFT